MIKLIGSIFKLIGKLIVLPFKICGWYYVLTDSTVRFLGIGALNSPVIYAISLVAVGMAYIFIASLIPDFIIYNKCKLSKEYCELKNENEKKEYISNHLKFALKVIFNLKNKHDRKNATITADKYGFLNRNDISANENKNKILDNIINNNIENNISLIESSNEPSLEENKETEKTKEVPLLEEKDKVIENTKEIIDSNESNVKILYSSNILGNALRNGVVLQRRFLTDEKPFLVDFSTVPPKEVFTGYECGYDSGIKVSKAINGRKVEMALDNPELLENPKFYDELNEEELKILKEELTKDYRYQLALRSFFSINDKALCKKK